MRIMLLWAACSVLLTIMTSPSFYYFARFLLGAAEAGLFPGVLLYLTYWVPAARRASFTAVFMAAIPLSGVISGPLSGMIMHSMDGWQGLKGWQWLFLIEGAPALLFAIVVFFFLKDTPASAPWLSLRERNLIEADLEADRTRSGGGHHSFMDAWRSPRFYLLVGMGVALLAGVGSLISPVIVGWLNEHTKTLAAGQYYLAALMIVGAVTVVAIGHRNRNRASAAPQLRVAA